MRKEISVDIFGDKDALKIVKEEIAAAKSSDVDVALKIEITGYFKGKRGCTSQFKKIWTNPL